MTIAQKDYQRLIHAAKDVQRNAYCVYSDFPVGAAILTDQNRIVTGCNVEIASYGGTICAERSAMVQVVSQHLGKPMAIAVIANTDSVVTPCGICRQFLSEFNPKMTVICCNKVGDSKVYQLDELLPHAFDSDELN